MQILKLCLMNMVLMLLINPRLYTFPSMLPFLKLGDTLYEPLFPLQRLSAFQAGWSAAWRNRLDMFNASRSRCTVYYTTSLSDTSGLTLFTKNKPQLPCIRFPVLFASEKAAKQVLAFGKRNGLGIAITYPDTVDSLVEVPAIAGGPYLQAKKTTRTLLTLPCHPLVRVRDMEKIVAGIKEIVRECDADALGL
jgi:dTDP-4-amino-4,6-dideoxygalactose transaminase